MILDSIHQPSDLRQLSTRQLQEVCGELRQFVIDNTQEKLGHINSSLGVTELTVALHYSFATPHDILIWDVGHQAYVHKVICDRKKSFHTNRLKSGIAGFTSRAESIYDPFGAGHSSTSISAAVGFAMSGRMSGKEPRQVIAVIGDGALTGGMSFEALNFAGEEQLDLLVILNDNQSSIDDNRGALAANNSYAEYAKSLGFNYLGDCDGNDVPALLEQLNLAKGFSGPRMLKVNTVKGSRGNESGAKNAGDQSFQTVFGNYMVELAERDPKLVVISPAMLTGGGLQKFQERFPERCIDVGIAEQHAVTMAAGMAADGSHPVVHLYSTFAQRAYDQIIHDVALQNLNIVFAIDRAGLVGRDGSTHHGVFDTAFLNTIPNIQLASPTNSAILKDTLRDGFLVANPSFIRFPKAKLDQNLEALGNSPRWPGVYHWQLGEKGAVLSFGAIASEVARAIKGAALSHYNINYLKPINAEFLRHLAHHYDGIICVEENSRRGGLGDTVSDYLNQSNFKGKVRSLALPDQFAGHGSRDELLQDCGLDETSLRELFVEFITH